MKMMRIDNVLQSVVIMQFFQYRCINRSFLWLLVRRITSEILMGSQETKQLREYMLCIDRAMVLSLLISILTT